MGGSPQATHSHLIHCCASGETKAKGDQQPQSGITASMLLVTGGAGFIGSNMVASLNEAGRADIAINDVLGSDAKWRNLAGRQLADFVPPAELMPWLDGRKLDAVIHFGAISSTTATDADDVMETNFRLSLRLLDWCAATRTPFIYASSAATYGNGEAGFLDIRIVNRWERIGRNNARRAQRLDRQIEPINRGILIEVAQDVCQLQRPAEMMRERDAVVLLHAEHPRRQPPDGAGDAVAIEIKRRPVGRARADGALDVHLHAVDDGEEILEF